MGHNDRIDEDSRTYNDFLGQLVNMGHLDGTALGITKLVIDKGVDCLSEKQAYVFQNEVLDKYVVKECKVCSTEIPWEEMYEAATDHGMCNWCWHRSTKDD